MARYSVFLKPSAVKEIEAVAGKDDRRRILERIQTLAVDPRPHGSVKLSGYQKYRLRQGSFRILYEIADDRLVVTVVKVGDRKDVYR